MDRRKEPTLFKCRICKLSWNSHLGYNRKLGIYTNKTDHVFIEDNLRYLEERQKEKL